MLEFFRQGESLSKKHVFATLKEHHKNFKKKDASQLFKKGFKKELEIIILFSAKELPFLGLCETSRFAA